MSTNIQVNIQAGEVPQYPPADVYRVRKWGDPVIVDRLGNSTALVDTSNFQVIQTASIGDNGKPFFNCVNRFQKTDINRLRSLQYPSDGWTVQQKMNWLIYYDGFALRPYWMKGTDTLYFGPLVFGGQLVKLGETKTVMGKYPNRDKEEEITFRRVVGVRRSDFGKYTYKSHPWFIQRATAAYRKPQEDTYIDIVKGEVFHPVWSDIDYPTNYGDGKMWLAIDFVEPKSELVFHGAMRL